MKWQILMFPLLGGALPQQRKTSPSYYVQPRSSETNSTKGLVWSFNPNYNPNAYVVESEISGPYYSKQNWEFRKVGDWLIEYAAQQQVANSDNFFEALYETPAFGRDNQERCGLTPAGDNCNGGQQFLGTITPFQLTNDEFNAQMVRQAIRNTFVYYRTLWASIGQAAQEVSPLVGQMVLTLEKPLVAKPSNFLKIMDAIGGLIQFAGVFLPVEGIVANVAEKLVTSEIKAAEAGSVFFQVSEEGAEKLVDATKKELTTGYNKIKDTYATGKAFLGKLVAIHDDPASDPDAHLGDVLDYQAGADEYGRSAQAFLENTWDAILNNGFSDGGIISQVYTGDVLDINTSGDTVSGTNDHGSDSYDKAVQQYFNYLMQRSMTQILMDHGVRVVKRGSYDSNDACMAAYGDKGYDWVDSSARGCFPDTDVPNKFSQYFPMVSDPQNVLGKKTYSGGKALFGSSWGDYHFDGQAFYQGASACTTSNGLWTDAQDKYTSEFTPQYTPPRVPDGSSQTLDASQLVCAYSVPVCDFGDGTFNEACKVYKSKMMNEVFNVAKQRGVSIEEREDDMGACGDRELLNFCLVSLEQVDNGSPSFNDIANAYVSSMDDLDIGYWGGLAGAELWDENKPEGYDLTMWGPP